MATTINSFSVSLGMDARGYIDGASLSRRETNMLVRDIESARSPLEKFAREQDRLASALDKGAISQGTYSRLLDDKRQKLGLAASSLNPYAAAIGATTVAVTALVGTGVAFVSHLRNVQDAIDSTADAAGKLGLSYNEVSGLRFAAQEGGGVAAPDVDAAMKKLQINIAKGVQGDSAINAAFEQLGLSAGDLMSAGATESFLKIADAMSGINDNGEKLKLTMDVFGKSGTELVSTLGAGRDAIQESIDFQQKWNGLTDEQVTAVGMNNDAWDRVGVIVEGLSTKLAAEFAPAMNLVADYILDGSEGFAGIDGAVRLVVDNTVLFAGYLKDAYELAQITQTTLYNIATLDFKGVGTGIADALDFSSGQNALEALNKKREEIVQGATEAARKRELSLQNEVLKERETSELDMIDRLAKEIDNSASERIRKEEQKRLDMQDKLARNSLQAAENHFKVERDNAKRLRDEIAKGPVSMEVGSADAAKFMADQVNTALAASVVVDQPPTEQQLIEQAKLQSELLQAADAREREMLTVMKQQLDKTQIVQRAR